MLEREKQMSKLAGAAASDRLGEDIKIIEVESVIGICDYFVIVSGRNPRQVKAISQAVEAELKTEMGEAPRYIEGMPEDWLLMDYGDIVIHVFTKEAREYYNLERLFDDCPKIPA